MKNMRNLRMHVVALTIAACIPAQAVEPQISAGRYHNLAVTNSGAVYWWGKEYGLSHHLGKPDPAQPPTLVSGLPTISAVAGGTWHSVALGEDGTVFEWGFSPFQMNATWTKHTTLGECEKVRLRLWTGHGKDPCADEVTAMYAKMYVEKPLPIPGIPAAHAIAATDSVTVALGRDGHVYCWDPRAAPQRIPGLEKITAIRLGHFHGVALRADGTVLTWGSNVNGELGSPPQNSSPVGESICRNHAQAVFTGAIDIGAGVSNSFALRADGSMWGWGRHRSLLLGGRENHGEDNVHAPRKIATIPKVTQIAGGSQHAVARSADGKVYAWGSNISNSIWPGDTLLQSNAPLELTSLGEIDAISAYDHNIALTHEGYVCAWGDNMFGAARPDSTLRKVLAPVPVMLADGKTPLKLLPNPGGKAPSTICGLADWRDRVAMWELALEKHEQHLKLLGAKAEQNWEHERELFLKVATKKGARVDKGDTALETAMRINDYDAMKELLATPGVDVNAQNSIGWTPLMQAVAKKDRESVNMLLAAGADANLGNGQGIDPLSLARRDNKTALIAILEKSLGAK